VVTEHHEQVDLPAGVAVYRVHLQEEINTNTSRDILLKIDRVIGIYV